MKRTLFITWCSLLVIVGVGAVAGAQETPPAEEPSPLLESDVDVTGIEEILRGEEEVL